jgi:hypothetical protein
LSKDALNSRAHLLIRNRSKYHRYLTDERSRYLLSFQRQLSLCRLALGGKLAIKSIALCGKLLFRDLTLTIDGNPHTKQCNSRCHKSNETARERLIFPQYGTDTGEEIGSRQQSEKQHDDQNDYD